MGHPTKFLLAILVLTAGMLLSGCTTYRLGLPKSYVLDWYKEYSDQDARMIDFWRSKLELSPPGAESNCYLVLKGKKKDELRYSTKFVLTIDDEKVSEGTAGYEHLAQDSTRYLGVEHSATLHKSGLGKASYQVLFYVQPAASDNYSKVKTRFEIPEEPQCMLPEVQKSDALASSEPFLILTFRATGYLFDEY